MSAAAAEPVQDGEAPASAPSKGKKKLIILVVTALLLVGGAGGGAAMFIKKKRAAAAAAEAAAAGAEAKKPATDESVQKVPLEESPVRHVHFSSFIIQ